MTTNSSLTTNDLRLTTTKSISIVGSGLVGSLLSVYLAKRGHQVNIYERRPDMRSTKISAGRSINLALSDRGLRGLKAAGIADDILKIAIPMYGRQIHHVDGTQTFQPYGKENQAIYSVSRSGINMALMTLAEKFENVKIKFEQRCTDVDLRKATAKFHDEKTGENSSIKSDIILGTDGAFSPVRLAMQTSTDMFNYSQTYLEHAYKELVIPANEDGSFKMEKNALHIWPRKSFMMIALPNIDGSFTCTLFLQLKGEESFETLKEEASQMNFMQKYFADVVAIMPTLQHDFFNNPTSTLVTVRCFPWSFEDKACLVGDAAHAIVPFFGQGMNCGFEDCVVFDEMMEKHGDNWKKLFHEFEQSRKPNGDAVAQLALDNFVEMRDKTADPKFLLRKKVEAKISAEHPNFLSMYAQVTFSPQISYHTAYNDGMRHSIHLEKLVAIENLFDKWETNEVQSVVKELVG